MERKKGKKREKNQSEIQIRSHGMGVWDYPHPISFKTKMGLLVVVLQALFSILESWHWDIAYAPSCVPEVFEELFISVSDH